MDVKRIALFTLGQWRQTASDADRDAFVDAFRDFMVANYSSMVGDYGGQTLKVTESVARNENDYVVTAQVVDPSNASNNSPPSQVQVRVLNESGKFVVVDASVEGVWLGLAQREDFTSFLKQQNGDLAALTERVRGLAEKLKSAK